MTRKAHLVGSWPGFSGAHAMDMALRRLGPHLLRLSDGETGERSQWIQPTLEWLRANPDVELVVDGDHSGYDQGTHYAVRAGRTLEPETIELGYQRAFARSYRCFQVLRERHDLPHVSFQVGIPTPTDLTNIAFGSAAAGADPQLLEAFTSATSREIKAIWSEARDDVVFQLESVLAMVAVARAADDDQADVAKRMARALTRVVALAPAGTRFGAHLCLGDYHHRALAEMGSARSLVTLATILSAQWPDARPLEYIHVPFAAAEKPGSLAPEWYEPLRELDLPQGVRFVAGFVHEDLGTDELRQIHSLIECNAGRQVDIAGTCGLARRPSQEQAWDAMDKTVALLTSASTSR